MVAHPVIKLARRTQRTLAVVWVANVYDKKLIIQIKFQTLQGVALRIIQEWPGHGRLKTLQLYKHVTNKNFINSINFIGYSFFM